MLSLCLYPKDDSGNGNTGVDIIEGMQACNLRDAVSNTRPGRHGCVASAISLV